MYMYIVFIFIDHAFVLFGGLHNHKNAKYIDETNKKGAKNQGY